MAENTRTWPRIRERACSIPFAWPGEEKRVSAKKARWKARLPAEPAGGIPERGKSSRRTMGGKAIPNRAGPGWKERKEEQEEGEPEGEWKSALWECQLDSSFLFARNGFKSERCNLPFQVDAHKPLPLLLGF